MAAGRILIALLLSFGVFGPALLRGDHRPRMNCCPDGETMLCCRHDGSCSFETCDESKLVRLPTAVSGFVLPLAPRLILPDRCFLSRDPDPGALAPNPLDRPDPPPRV